MRKFYATTDERVCFVVPGIVIKVFNWTSEHEVKTTAFAAFLEEEAVKNKLRGYLEVCTVNFKLNEFPGIIFNGIRINSSDIRICRATYASWCDLDSIPEVWDFIMRRNALGWLQPL